MLDDGLGLVRSVATTPAMFGGEIESCANLLSEGIVIDCEKGSLGGSLVPAIPMRLV